MKINFVLNAMGISGGVKAAFMLAQQFKRFGHDVNIIYPKFPMRLGNKLKEPAKLLRQAGYLFLDRWKPVQWYGNVNVIKVPTLSSRHIPDADVTIAHEWETSYCTNEYPVFKGVKFYHVQDHENWYGDEKEIVESYQLGQKIIVHSQWLKRIVERWSKVQVVIPHAPDHETLYPDETIRSSNYIVRILMCYRKEKWKGMESALKAIKMTSGYVSLIMFGVLGKCKYDIAEYYANPLPDKLRRIYNSADVFIFPSEREGWGMPPMEAMACSVPVVSTSVGAVPEFMVNGVSGIIVNPTDTEAMALAIESLVNNPAKRIRMGYQGYMAMKKYRWENSARILEKEILKWL